LQLAACGWSLTITQKYLVMTLLLQFYGNCLMTFLKNMIKFNPEKKMKRRYLPFFLLFVSSLVFAGRVIPLPGLLKPQRIYIDQEQCFITEGATISIYSLKDFKLQKKFGKRGDRLKFPAAFPPIRNFHIVDNKIYVVTYKEKDNQCWMLVFDLGGKLLKEVFVSLVDINMLIPDLYNYYTIHEDKLYILRDNQDTEEWELHIDPMARGAAYLALRQQGQCC
jgi:hypothetical protein